MMKKKWSYIVFIIIIFGCISIWLYNKYKPTKNHLELVPNNASIIVTFNLKNLFSKLNSGDIKSTELYQYLIKKQNTNIQKNTLNIKYFTDNPLTCGLNLLSNSTLFIEEEKDIEIANLVIAINDEKALKKTFEKSLNPYIVIQKKNNFHFIQYNKNCIISWNKKGLILSFFLKDTLLQKSNTQTLNIISKYYNLNHSENITNNKSYIDNSNSQNDISAFVNYTNVLKYLKLKINHGAYNYLIYELPNKPLYALCSLNFNQNDISLNTKFIDKLPFEILNFSNPQNYSVINKNSLANISLNCNSEILLNILNQDNLINKNLANLLKKNKLQFSDLTNMFNGNFIANLNGIYNYKEKITYSVFDENDFSYKQLDSIKNFEFPKFNTTIGIKNSKTFNHLTSNIFSNNNTLPYGVKWQIKNNILHIYNDSNNTLLNHTDTNNIAIQLNLNPKDYPIALHQMLFEKTPFYRFKKHFLTNQLFLKTNFTLNCKSLKLDINVSEGKENVLFKIIRHIKV